MATTLVVMAKYPQVGSVKTRLADSVGAEEARRLYCAFLADVAATFSGSSYDLLWAMTPPGSRLADIVGEGARYLDQRGADLGERMREVFRDLCDASGPVVMIGADVPHLGRDRVAALLAALAHCDVAIVPSDDGGYCAIAMRGPHDVFDGVPMGTEKVLGATLERVAALGLRCTCIETCFDVDEIADVCRLETEIADEGLLLPATATVVADWRQRGLLA